MALSKAKSPNLLEDKQTVVTNLARTNAIGLKMFLNDKLPKWIENRKCAKILVICGAHGETDGSIVEEAQPNSLHNLKVSHKKHSILICLNLNLYETFFTFCRMPGSKRNLSLMIRWTSSTFSTS